MFLPPDSVAVERRHPQALAVDSGNPKVFIANTHAGTVAVLNGTNETVVGSL